MKEARNDVYILNKKIERGQTETFHVLRAEDAPKLKKEHAGTDTKNSRVGSASKFLFIGGTVWKLPV